MKCCHYRLALETCQYHPNIIKHKDRSLYFESDVLTPNGNPLLFPQGASVQSKSIYLLRVNDYVDVAMKVLLVLIWRGYRVLRGVLLDWRDHYHKWIRVSIVSALTFAVLDYNTRLARLYVLVPI